MKTISLQSVILAVVLTWSLLWSDSLISAREIPESPAVSQQAKVSERELRAFAKVNAEFQSLAQQYEPSLNSAQEPDQRNKIRQEVITKAQQALAKQNLTEESYGRILKLVSDDVQLRDKALKLIEQERKKGSSGKITTPRS